MADDAPSDEQRLHQAFQQVADVLLPLEQELRERALAMLVAFLGVPTPSGGLAEAGASRPAGERSPPPTQIAPHEEPPSLQGFLSQKQPNTDVERVACLAYYLTHYLSTKYFKTIDISKLNAEVAQRKFVSAATSVKNATQEGFLASVHRHAPTAKGMKKLTAKGDRYVDALPNRVADKATLGK